MELKTLIACYSYSGHTLKVAEALKKAINADLTQIESVKDKWYLFKLLDAIRGKKVPIKPCQTDLMSYQGFVLCCPVWAGRTPAAINQYLVEIKNVKGKQFGVFVTSGGNRPQKATIQMREYLDKEDMQFIGQMRILTKDVEKEDYGEIFDIFVKKFV
jgi:menaquinone-dependent protoporphyrinogen IX oxidase